MAKEQWELLEALARFRVFDGNQSGEEEPNPKNGRLLRKLTRVRATDDLSDRGGADARVRRGTEGFVFRREEQEAAADPVDASNGGNGNGNGSANGNGSGGCYDVLFFGGFGDVGYQAIRCGVRAGEVEVVSAGLAFTPASLRSNMVRALPHRSLPSSPHYYVLQSTLYIC